MVASTRLYEEVHNNSEALVLAHLSMVKRVALHLKVRIPPFMELDELIQVGMIGLLEAARSYMPSKGVDFENLDQMVSQVDANGNPTTVYTDQADGIMNRMLAGMHQLSNLNAATPATQELARFQMIAQAAYEAGVLLQFHPGPQAGQAAPVAPPPASAQPANQVQRGSVRQTRTGQFEMNFGSGWVPFDPNNPQHAAYMQALQAGTAP
jgi:hypothetical protein